jgi:hypothetical protein
MKRTRFRLVGYDTFSNEWYNLNKTFKTETAAIRAAKKRLEHLEETQPSASSGGQGAGGIQDRVFVERPNGTRFRV